jgi:hypothetical protein
MIPIRAGRFVLGDVEFVGEPFAWLDVEEDVVRVVPWRDVEAVGVEVRLLVQVVLEVDDHAISWADDEHGTGNAVLVGLGDVRSAVQGHGPAGRSHRGLQHAVLAVTELGLRETIID